MNRAPVSLIRRVRALAVLTLVAALTTAAYTSTSSAKYAGRLLGGGASPAKRAAAVSPALRGSPAEAGAADASLTTDKTDYQPGETVVISGSGFAAGESVSLTLTEDPAKHPDTQLSATADEYGNFVNKDFSPTEEHVGTAFTAKAVGQTSGRTAEAKFNDGPNWSYSSVPNPATLSVTTDGSPHSVNATVNVIAPDSGNGKPSPSNVITVAPQFAPGATPIPNSWISPLPNLTFNTSPQNLPWNVTVTVPPYTAAGSYSTMLKANPPPMKGGPGSGILITVNVTADSSAPNTTLSAAKADTTSYNGVDWTNQAVTVTLAATDSGTPTTGVAFTKYNLDGTGYQTYTAPFTVSTQALHTLLYFSQDNQGNVETPAKSFTIKIDKTKPVITLNGAAEMSVVYGSGPFSDPGATATDTGGSGLNGSVNVSGSVNTNAAGDYTLSYNVSDNAGNAADTVTRTVHVLKADQTITFGALSDKTYGDPDFSVSATAGSGDPVTFSASGNCTVTGSTVHITGAGPCTITAHQAGNSNYNAAPDVPQSFNINKAATTTTVTCGAGPFTYNGSPQTPCSASVTGPAGLNQTLTVDYLDNTNAGTATASATYAGDSNYLGSSDSKTFQIGKAATTTTVTCAAGPFTYDGTPQTPCTANVTGAGGLNQSLSVSYANNTNAGTATASASYAESANYFGSSDSKNFIIDKAASVTTVTCGAGPFTYDGSAQTPCSASVTGAGGLSQPLTVNYSDNTNAGAATASASYAGDANHDGSSNSTTFEIAKASSATTVICPSNVTYDGSAQTPCSASVSGAGGLNQPLSVNYSNNTNAGTASASASYAGDANHDGSSDSKNFTIDKAASTTVVNCPSNVTYDGSAQTPCTASVSGAGGLSQSLTVNYSDNTNAGTASASASYSGDLNHDGSSDSKTFTIDKATSTTVVTCPSSVTYDGSPQTPCTASVTGAGGLSQLLSVSYAGNTNAGTASASASFAGDDNHDGSSDSKNFIIDKAASTTVVTCSSSVTYDGSAQTPCTASVSGAGGLSQGLSVSYSNNVNAGTASASASYAGDANHNSSSDSKNFAIDKAGSTTTVTCGAGPFTYNGSPQTPCTASVTGAGGLNQSLAVSYANNVNAGAATASASYPGDANHNASSDSKNFTIGKANATINVNGYTGYYDGAAHGATGTATGVNGEDLSSLLNLGNTFTNVPGGTVNWTFNASNTNTNYNSASGSVQIVINAWTPKGFFSPVVPSTTSLVWNNIKSGSTVPLKFTIFVGSTPKTSTSAVAGGSLSVAQISCNDMGINVTDALDTTFTNSGSTSLRYDSTAGQFIQNWQSPSMPSTCYRVMMKAADGSSLQAFFKLVK
jgi:hypothetical protein